MQEKSDLFFNNLMFLADNKGFGDRGNKPKITKITRKPEKTDKLSIY